MWEDCETELRHLEKIGPNKGVAIDIGANLGLFAYKMSRWYDEVYAFEINDDLTQLLEAYRAENIHVINKGVSSKTGHAVLHIPVVQGEALTGWATLNPNIYPNVERFDQKEVEICRLDDYNFGEVGLIKIDVEGHELEVIEGAIETILKSKPFIIAEIKTKKVGKIRNLLKDNGYTITNSGDVVGVPSKKNNYIFKPPGKLHCGTNER